MLRRHGSLISLSLSFFFFTDTSTTEIYTLSLHDALPISATFYVGKTDCGQGTGTAFRQMMSDELDIAFNRRSEEHTSELQSLRHLVCRLLLEKKKEEGWLL